MAQQEIGGQKYVVRLSGEERVQLESMLSKGKHSAKTLVKALIRKRRFRPIAAGMEEQLAIRCDKALQSFGAKLCQRLVQRAGKPGPFNALYFV